MTETPAPTVLLTGITGFLGGHVALELLRSGYHVRGSLRNAARIDETRATLARHGADLTRLDLVPLDLTRDDGWAEAARGAEYLMHTASPFVTTMPKDPATLIGPAVAGTERAIGAALAAGCRRIVLTSSTAAIVYGRGPGGPARLGPDDWADPDGGRLNAYAQSKVRAERRAWALMEAAGRRDDLTVINPGMILGPLLDADPGTSGAIVLRLMRGELPAAPRLYQHLVDVRDLARIHVAALTAPATFGQRVPAAFATVSIKAMSEILGRALPAYAGRMPRFTLPDWVARLYGRIDGDLRANLVELGYEPELDAARARALLGRPPVSPEATIAATGQSLIEQRLLAA